jgi:hypothetical protein
LCEHGKYKCSCGEHNHPYETTTAKTTKAKSHKGSDRANHDYIYVTPNPTTHILYCTTCSHQESEPHSWGKDNKCTLCGYKGSTTTTKTTKTSAKSTASTTQKTTHEHIWVVDEYKFYKSIKYLFTKTHPEKCIVSGCKEECDVDCVTIYSNCSPSYDYSLVDHDVHCKCGRVSAIQKHSWHSGDEQGASVVGTTHWSYCSLCDLGVPLSLDEIKLAIENSTTKWILDELFNASQNTLKEFMPVTAAINGGAQC